MAQYLQIESNEAEWWKYPDSFLKVMNTGEIQQVTREDINSEILESLIPGWKRQRKCPDDPLVKYIEVPRSAGHVIHTAWSDVPGFGIDNRCYTYLDTGHRDDWTWEAVEDDFFALTDQSNMEWHMPQKPESKPFLAVFRLTESGQLTAPNAPAPGPVWLADVESALGFLFLKTLSKWLSRWP